METSIKNYFQEYQQIAKEQKENDDKLKRAEKSESTKL